MDWTIYSWYCPNCKNEVAGVKNRKNQIKVKCKMCGSEMIRTIVGRRHDVIDIYAPTGQEHDHTGMEDIDAIRLEELVQERNETLFSLDRKRIEEYLIKYGEEETAQAPDPLFWASVFKAICGIRGVPEGVMAEARAWLSRNGFAVPEGQQ